MVVIKEKKSVGYTHRTHHTVSEWQLHIDPLCDVFTVTNKGEIAMSLDTWESSHQVNPAVDADCSVQTLHQVPPVSG